MDGIRQAIERAKSSRSEQQSDLSLVSSGRGQNESLARSPHENRSRTEEVALDVAHLQSHRIVAYDGRDTRTRPFDMLRTEVLRLMDVNGWKTLAVTSPTPGCGKTLIAINLAFSIGRQPERRASLIDLDFRKPRVASCLGLKSRQGTVGVIEGKTEIDRRDHPNPHNGQQAGSFADCAEPEFVRFSCVHFYEDISSGYGRIWQIAGCCRRSSASSKRT